MLYTLCFILCTLYFILYTLYLVLHTSYFAFYALYLILHVRSSRPDGILDTWYFIRDTFYVRSSSVLLLLWATLYYSMLLLLLCASLQHSTATLCYSIILLLLFDLRTDYCLHERWSTSTASTWKGTQESSHLAPVPRGKESAVSSRWRVVSSKH